jgi:hypothetical protein
MSQSFLCPYLKTFIELTEERYQHILSTHPGTLPDYLTQLADTHSASQRSDSICNKTRYKTVSLPLSLRLLYAHRLERVDALSPASPDCADKLPQNWATVPQTLCDSDLSSLASGDLGGECVLDPA